MSRHLATERVGAGPGHRVRSKQDILFLVSRARDRPNTSRAWNKPRPAAPDQARLRKALHGVTRVMIKQNSAIHLVSRESRNLEGRSAQACFARVRGWIDPFEKLVD